MKKVIFLFVLILSTVASKAQQMIYVCQGDNYTSYDISALGDMIFGNSGTTLSIFNQIYDVSQIDSITFTEPLFDMGAKVIITYSETSANVRVSSSLSGITYKIDGADVTITSTNTKDDISYVLQGAFQD